MFVMVWKLLPLLLLLLLLQAGSTFQDRKTEVILAYKVSSDYVFPLHAY